MGVSGKTSPASVSRKRQEESVSVSILEKKTIESYAHCLKLFMIVELPKFHFDEDRQARHLGKCLSPFELKDYPKVFKGMLADFFSKRMQQIRPDVPLTYENLFYKQIQRRIMKTQHNSKTKEARLFWNLMHCKVNACEVPQSMILESYVKHSKILSEEHRTNPNLLTSFGTFISEYVDEVVKLLPIQEKKVPLARQHAAFDIARSKGGVKLIDSCHNIYHHPKEGERIDPTTFMLSGSPGMGKSLLQAHIKKILKKRHNFDTYERNASTDHWDGYKNQTLTLMDDFNQRIVSKNEITTEWTEFIALNSTIDYVLPMAKLSEKGTKFTSPLIIYSTNDDLYQFELSASKQIKYLEAAKRRVDQWFHISKKEGKIQCNRVTYDSYKSLANHIVDELLGCWEKKSSFYNGEFDDRIHHTCFNDGLGSYGYSYPSHPENITDVNVHAIAEPLKVRTITIGDKNLYALKPLQKAMFKALDLYKCMTPCKTPDYLEELQDLFTENDSRRKFWLSGDYTSATDGLHADIQQKFTEVLIERLGEDHPLAPYILADSGVHTLHYPPWTGIPATKQTNGQLMGSLMSFPILCLANAFTLCYAMSTQEKLVTLHSVPALFHGDDLLARVTHQQYEDWEQVAKSIGLGLSMGKNYLSREWGSIDSQLYGQDHNLKVVKLNTGKFRCMSPDSTNVEAAITQLLKREVPKPTIVSFLKEQLKETPRSIDVHTDYGGLDPNGRKPESALEHSIAYLKYSKVVACRLVTKVDDKYICECPKALTEEYPSTSYRIVDLSSETQKSSLWKALKPLKKVKPQVNTDLDLLQYSEKSNIIVSKDMYIRLTRRARTILASETLTTEDRKYFQALNYINNRKQEA